MCKIIAILRGVEPSQVLSVGAALIENGIRQIEVPLNSPDPFRSIGLLVAEFGKDAIIGAGTVLSVDQVQKLADIGARIVVSPNSNGDVIRHARKCGMICLPGVMTPGDCFSALEAGADGLKFFPASVLGPGGFKAIKATLPAEIQTYAVGGIGPDNFSDWIEAGVTGFGIGTSLFAPGMSAHDVANRARTIAARFAFISVRNT